jgi:putative ABC transport system ATP-binding protein
VSPAAPAAERHATGAEVAIESVSKSYGAVRALTGVTLGVARGELVVVGGPSGSGKSTLLQIAAGFTKPDSGSVLVDGRDVATMRDPAGYRRDVIGVVFQSHHLLPALSARMNVEVALLGAGVPGPERHLRAERLLDEVGVGHRTAHPPHELSGGERQCVAVARALANRPRLLLADEPTAALDDAAASRILDLLDTLRREQGMTVLAVSHDAAMAERSDHRVRLVGGRINPRPGSSPPP